jgi:hypothetical protein
MSLALHLKLRRGFLFADFHLVICPSSHATTYTAEHNISNEIDNCNNSIITLKVDADVEARSADRKALKTVIAPDQTHIVLIQTQTVLLHNQLLTCTDRHTRAANRLTTHAALWAVVLPKISRLNAATSPKHTLAA